MEEDIFSSEANDFQEYQNSFKFKKSIKSEYDKYFEEWYNGKNSTIQANLLVLIDESSFTSGYCKCCKTIIISQSSANLEDIEESILQLHEKDWVSWKKELIHEMLHEYVDKVPFKTTPEGLELYYEFQESPEKPKISKKNNGLGFEGVGHNEKFYTLIHLFSNKFNLTPIEFKKQL